LSISSEATIEQFADGLNWNLPTSMGHVPQEHATVRAVEITDDANWLWKKIR